MQKRWQPTAKTLGWIIIISNIIFVIVDFSKIMGLNIFFLWFYFCPSSLLFVPDSIGHYISAAATSLINISLGIGILSLKKIFRTLFVVHLYINGFVAAFMTVHYSMYLLYAVSNKGSWDISAFFHAVWYIAVILVYIFVIVFLNGSKVKEQFR
ncbi:MAG: hypothetical protein ISS45_13510 [Candidatus Omnitrophica bacterium]|nr:hypothetical protein [Candidatus Omnitrophota bacterium]